MFDKFWGIERKRIQEAHRVGNTPLKQYLSCPFARLDQKLGDVEIIALDFETTGLELNSSQILSIGAVDISCGNIVISRRWHQVIKAKGTLPEDTVVIHQITHDDLIEGIDLAKAMEKLLGMLRNKIILVHNAIIERSFLEKTSKELYQGMFYARFIDTQVLLQRKYKRQGKIFRPSDLRLFNARKDYGLPQYKAHHAFYDALATAELFLALVEEMGGYNKLCVRDVVL